MAFDFGGTSGAANILNVKEYGAKGDGNTDDTTSLNNAIAALNAAGGGILFFPAGAYKITSNPTTMTKPIEWRGAGRDLAGTSSVTKISWQPANNGVFWGASNINNCGLTNMVISQDNAATGTLAINIQSCSYGFVKDVTILGVTNRAFTMNAGSADVSFWQVTNVDIIGAANNASPLLRCAGNAASGFFCQQNTFIGCRFTNTYSPFNAALLNNGFRNNSFINCEFSLGTGNSTTIVSVDGATGTGHSQGNNFIGVSVLGGTTGITFNGVGAAANYVSGNITSTTPVAMSNGATAQFLDGNASTFSTLGNIPDVGFRDKGSQLFNVMAYGAVGDNATDDTAAIQAAINAARGGGTVFFPKAAGYKITSTLSIVPTSGQQVYVNLQGMAGPDNKGLVWGGGNTGTVVSAFGWKYSQTRNLAITIPATATGVTAWDLDVDAGRPSTGQLAFYDCFIFMTTGSTNSIGWRFGHTGGLVGGSEMSFMSFYGCVVSGSGAATGSVAWSGEHQNCLQNWWVGGGWANVAKGFTNIPSAGAAATQGGDAVYFYGLGVSSSALDYEFNTAGSYQIVGGRYELGQRILDVKTSSAGYQVGFTGCEFQAYAPSDGILFKQLSGGSLNLTNMIVSTSTIMGGVTFTLGGIGPAHGTLTVNGCTLGSTSTTQATLPLHSVSGTTWDVSYLNSTFGTGPFQLPNNLIPNQISTLSFKGTPWHDVKAYGAKGDLRSVTDGAITNGLAVLTSITAVFTAADVGKIVNILGAGAAGAPLSTTISVFTNVTTVTVAVAASISVTGATTLIGTDDKTAFLSLAAALPSTGANVVFPPGNYFLSDAILFQGLTNLTVTARGATIRPAASTQWGNTGGKRYVLQFNDCPGLRIAGLNGDGNGAAQLAAPTTGWWAILGVTSTGTSRDLSSTYLTTDVFLQDVTITNFRALALRFNRVNGLRLSRVTVNQGFQDSGANNSWDAVSCVKVDGLKVDDCDMDGGANSSATQGTIGSIFAVSPGNSGNDTPTQAINNADVLNYNRLSQFIAPAASVATSTCVISYGLIANPSTAPVITDGGVAGTLTGATYTVAYTLVNIAGETIKSADSTGLVLAAGHQINVAALTSLPNGVWGVKFYITNVTDKGLVTIAGSTTVPVVANATAAVSITATGNGANTPGSNTTLATEVNGVASYLANNTWDFFCVTPGSGTGSQIIPGNAIKVTAVDQTNKLITFERHDTSEGSGTQNWSGQLIYVSTINQSMFCSGIRIRNSRFDRSGVSGGVFLLGCIDFVVQKCRATGNGDVAFDAEWCVEGEFDSNRIDITGKNTGIGVLFRCREIQVHHNRIKADGRQGVFCDSGYTMAYGLSFTDNIFRGCGLQLTPSGGQGWDNIQEDIVVKGNIFRGDNVGFTSLSTYHLLIGVQDATTNTGGRVRGVSVTENIFDGSSQRPLQYTGVEGLSIRQNHFRNTGYDCIYESNTNVTSLNVSIEDNYLSNIGTRGSGSFGIYRSAVSRPGLTAPFIGAQFWHSIDSSIDSTQNWGFPGGSALHPIGGDYLVVGPTVLRHSTATGGELESSLDMTRGNNGTWAPVRIGRTQTTTPSGAFVTYTPDATIGELQEIIQGTTAQTLTIAAPANRVKGQFHTFKFVHFADTSTWTLTWNAVFKRAGGSFANTNTSGAVDTITFYDDGTNLRETGRAINLS